MALEVLRAQLKAAGNLKRELTSTAVAARETSTEMDDLSDEATNAGASAAVLSEGLDEAAEESVALAQREAVAAQQTESLGDEMLQTAAQAGVLEEALEDVDAGGLSAEFAGLRGNITRVATVAAAATPALLGLGAAVGGLATGGATLGAGAIGLTAAGIQSRAEQTAALSSELENAAEAREQLLGNFRSRLADAFEPLQNAQTEQFALANLEAVVSIAQNAAGALERLQDTIIDVGSAFRATLVDVSGDVFNELAVQGERLAPLLLQLRGAIRELPGLIRLLGDAAVRLGPGIFNAAGALGRITAAVTEFGIAALEILLPPLNAVLEVLAIAGDIFRSLPKPIKQGIGAFAAITAAVIAFSAAASAAAVAVGVLTAPITGTALAVAALTGLVVALLSEFGLLEGVLNAIANPFDTIRDTINGIGEAVGDLVPDIELLNGVLEDLGLNAEQTDEKLNELDPSADAADGDGETTSGGGDDGGGLASSLGGDRGQFENIGLFAGGGGLASALGGGGIFESIGLLGAGGTLLGGGISAGIFTGLVSAVTDPDGDSDGDDRRRGVRQPQLDASDSGRGGTDPGRDDRQPDLIQNNNITVSGVANPTETRQAVRRAVEDANRQRRNAESGRVD